MGRFNGRTALVTGAARGIGRGIALCLATEGADLAINDLADPEEVQEVVDSIRQLGRRARYWQGDVANRAFVARLMRQVVDDFGYLSICVANAGISIPEYVVQARWENVLRTVEVTQFGVFHTCQLAARQMVQQIQQGVPGGKIIIISSVHVELAVRGSAAYNMAKAAVTQLGQTLAVELAPHCINVNVVHPGLTDTPGTRTATTPEALERAAARIPWGRLGTPEDVGKAVAFLASSDADYITGVSLRVDGGFTLGLRLPLEE